MDEVRAVYCCQEKLTAMQENGSLLNKPDIIAALMNHSRIAVI